MAQAIERVEVLLATWNGTNYLDEQLASLMGQTWPHLEVLVRDDGSTDGTPALLQRWVERYPERIRILPTGGSNLGASGNFAALLAASTGDYVMFCDQDDCWHADKVEASLVVMRELEQAHPDLPLLVHGDLRVVDASLAEIAPSFARFQNLDLGLGGVFRRVLVQNTVTGCTMLLNRRLVELSQPIPGEAMMHDHWIALVAAAFGKVGTLHRALLDYRQHGRNTIGASGHGVRVLLGRVRGSRAEMRRRLAASWRQAQAFEKRYAARLDSQSQAIVRAWAGMPQRGFFARRAMLIRHGLWKCGLLRNLMTLVAM